MTLFNKTAEADELPKEFKLVRSQVMYIEDKSSGLVGNAPIGRVYFSRSGHTLYYKGRRFRSLTGMGFKSNSFDVDHGHEFWISGPQKNLQVQLF